MMKPLFVSLVLTAGLCASCTMSTQHSETVVVTKSNQTDTIKSYAIGFVQQFYTAYTSSIYNDASLQTIDSLKNAYLTKPLLEKVKNLISETGADPIIRAQDFSERVAKTLSYKALKNDRVLVQYVDTKDTVKITVKVVKVDDYFKIEDISAD